MSDSERDPNPFHRDDRLSAPTPARVAASWLYRAGRSIHRSVYEKGFRSRGKLEAPVICVGNLTVGGTGKTPFLIELTRQLCSRGWNPAILSRGYGSRPPAREPRIVSDGRGYLAEVERAGDEPYLIARSCPSTSVIIGAKRYASGCLAEREFDPDLFLLDDGFQHEALARDVDLVLWDARDRPSQLRLLPAGRLREPLTALSRASAVILTHAEYLEGGADEAWLDTVEAELREYVRSDTPRFRMISRLAGFRRLAGNLTDPLVPLSDFKGEKVFLVSGLARPEGFETMVRNAGLKIDGHWRLPDHADYKAAQVEEIKTEAVRHGSLRILTTAKDAVKIERFTNDEMFGVVELEIRIEDAHAWREFVDTFAPQRNLKEA